MTLEEIGKIIEKNNGKFIEIITYWADDEGNLYGYPEMYFEDIDPVPVDLYDLSSWDIEQHLPTEGIYHIYPDGRLSQVGNAYMPEPEMIFEYFNEKNE